MFALINTMNNSSDVLGRIISVHLTAQAAGRANGKIQRRVARDNGQACFLPTTVRVMDAGLSSGKPATGDCVYRNDGRPLDDDEHYDYSVSQM